MIIGAIIVTIFSVIATLSYFSDMHHAQSAPQQAVAAASAIFIAFVPYVLFKVWYCYAMHKKQSEQTQTIISLGKKLLEQKNSAKTD